MEDEIEKLKKVQAEEKEKLKKKHQKQLSTVRTRIRKQETREKTAKRKSLVRLDIIMGALVRSTIPKEGYLTFISEVADVRDCEFATQRYEEWCNDGNKSNNSYQLLKGQPQQPELSGFSQKPTEEGGLTSQQ